MSGYNIYIWDADQTVGKNIFEGTESILESIPQHDTEAENYQIFLDAINAFISDAEQQYPDMMYGGHYTLDNHISIEPIPYEILDVYRNLIIETAINNNLCVYDPLGDTLDTPEGKKSYKVGTALSQWEKQKQADADRQALLESDEESYPKNNREMNKLVTQVFKDRLKEAGIKGVKKDSEGFRRASFENTDLKFALIAENQYSRDSQRDETLILVTLDIQLNINYEYAIAIKNGVSNISLDFMNDLQISDKDIYKSIYCIVHDKSKLRYEINRAIDMFINVYSHAQTLKSFYKYVLNTHNDPKLKRRIIGNRIYNPVSHDTLLLLAYLTKQPNYEQIKEALYSEWLDWNIVEYNKRKQIHDDRMERIAQEDTSFKKRPYHAGAYGGVLGDDYQDVIKRYIDEQIKTIESFSVEDALSNE